jgi:hypothetical protein
MAIPTSSLKFEDLCNEVGQRVFGTRTISGGDLDEAKELVNLGYLEFLHEEEWSFLYPETTIALWASFSTGTYTGTSTGTSLAAGSAIFYDSMVGATIAIASTDFTITAVTNSSVCSLSADPSATGATLAMDADGRYRLPENFGNLETDPSYASGATGVSGTLQKMSPERIRDLQSGSDVTSKTLYYAVQPVEFTTSSGQMWELLGYPIPESTRSPVYQYRVEPAKMVSTAEYPLGGAAHAMTILAASLKQAERAKGQTQGVDHDLYERRLISSRRRDARAKVKNLGYMADGPYEPGWIIRRNTVEMT